MPGFFRNKSGSARSRKMQGNKSCPPLRVAHKSLPSAIATLPCCTASSPRGSAGSSGSFPPEVVPGVCNLAHPLWTLFFKYLWGGLWGASHLPRWWATEPCATISAWIQPFQSNQAIETVLPHPASAANQPWWPSWWTHYLAQTFSGWADVTVEGRTKAGLFALSLFFPWQGSCALRN